MALGSGWPRVAIAPLAQRHNKHRYQAKGTILLRKSHSILVPDVTGLGTIRQERGQKLFGMVYRPIDGVALRL